MSKNSSQVSQLDLFKFMDIYEFNYFKNKYIFKINHIYIYYFNDIELFLFKGWCKSMSKINKPN